MIIVVHPTYCLKAVNMAFLPRCCIAMVGLGILCICFLGWRKTAEFLDFRGQRILAGAGRQDARAEAALRPAVQLFGPPAVPLASSVLQASTSLQARTARVTSEQPQTTLPALQAETTSLAHATKATVDHWMDPGTPITWYYATVVDESEHIARIPIELMLFKICFAEILVVIDIPHGGCTYGQARLKGGPSTFASFLESRARKDLLAEVGKVLKKAADAHARRCPNPLETRAEIVDYTANTTFGLFNKVFNTTWQPPSTDGTHGERRWPWAYMWKNTMNYVIGVDLAAHEFVFHNDDDMAVKSQDNSGMGRFVAAALQEFNDSPDLLIAQLSSECSMNKINAQTSRPYKEIDGVKLAKKEETSTQVFITTKSRWARLTPMSHWRQFFEPILVLNVKRVGMRSVFFRVPGVCRIGYYRAVNQTALTHSEKSEAAFAWSKSFSSNAKQETFNLTGVYSKCKHR